MGIVFGNGRKISFGSKRRMTAKKIKLSARKTLESLCLQGFFKRSERGT